MKGEDVVWVACVVLLIFGSAYVLYCRFDYLDDMKRCMAEDGWMERCNAVRQINPGFDCEHEYYDEPMVTMAWPEYACTIKVRELHTQPLDIFKED